MCLNYSPVRFCITFYFPSFDILMKTFRFLRIRVSCPAKYSLKIFKENIPRSRFIRLASHLQVQPIRMQAAIYVWLVTTKYPSPATIHLSELASLIPTPSSFLHRSLLFSFVVSSSPQLTHLRGMLGSRGSGL